MTPSPWPRAGTLDPSGVLARLPEDVPAVAVRTGRRWVLGADPVEIRTAEAGRALDTVRALPEGWWAGYLAYDVGREIESVPVSAAGDRDLLDLALMRFDARLVLDDDTSTAWIEGDGAGRTLLEEAIAGREPASMHGPGLEHWTSSLDREAFESRVDAVRELIHAGECYQVNLTRRLTCDRVADPVALFGALARHNPAPHLGCYRFDGTSVVSASPERFLRWRGGRGGTVETRPIKGTNANAAALQSSAKDRAENVMIVDLARNDLGRVCEFGSVVTPSLCALESHPGLHHLVSTVRGRLRRDVEFADVLHATFPPASVTGAPKPRVLAAIEELEPVRRGVYCGAVGWIDTRAGEADLAVAIRTFTITGAGTDLGVGGGIVADSRPASEWAETELKAHRLLEAAGVPTAARVP